MGVTLGARLFLPLEKPRRWSLFWESEWNMANPPEDGGTGRFNECTRVEKK
jgi:hypothetical protein